jgi:hypothetical protein
VVWTTLGVLARVPLADVPVVDVRVADSVAVVATTDGPVEPAPLPDDVVDVDDEVPEDAADCDEKPAEGFVAPREAPPFPWPASAPSVPVTGGPPRLLLCCAVPLAPHPATSTAAAIVAPRLATIRRLNTLAPVLVPDIR